MGSYEDRRDARAKLAVERINRAIDAYRQTRPMGRPVRSRSWTAAVGDQTVDQPLDPKVFGLGILYALEADEQGRHIVVRFDGGSSEYIRVEALELVDDPRHSFHGHQYDFYHATVTFPLPSEYASFGQEREAGVSMSGGGTTDPHKVGIAARVLELAAFLAGHLGDQHRAIETQKANRNA